MEPITQDMVDCWRANYGLDARSPADAARYWTETCAGMAPAGAVAALGLLLQERDARHAAADIARKGDSCVAALSALLERYTDLVNCGDCGNWNPEREDQVIAARAALAAVGAA